MTETEAWMEALAEKLRGEEELTEEERRKLAGILTRLNRANEFLMRGIKE